MKYMSNIFDTLIEIELKEENGSTDASFLKVKETLTRIGIASKKDKTLYQSCHILHKKGRYYLVHFLEMFAIDGKGRGFTDEDKGRRNTIARLLQEWGLIKILNPEVVEAPIASMKTIRVVPFKEKNEYNLVEKYSMGSNRD
jgi:hypothetical protein